MQLSLGTWWKSSSFDSFQVTIQNIIKKSPKSLKFVSAVCEVYGDYAKENFEVQGERVCFGNTNANTKTDGNAITI